MSSSDDCHPFDGTCELSKNADFTLTFDDGTYLKTSRSFLKLSSPVLKTAMGECQHKETLHLPRTSKDTWVLILNYLHTSGRPGRRVEELVKREMKDEFMDVLRQSQLYGFVSLIQDLDRRIAVSIYANPVKKYQPSMTQESLNPVPPYIGVSSDMWFLPVMQMLKMPKSQEALAAYWMDVLKENQSRHAIRVKLKREVDCKALRSAFSTMHTIVKDLPGFSRREGSPSLAQGLPEA